MYLYVILFAELGLDESSLGKKYAPGFVEGISTYWSVGSSSRTPSLIRCSLAEDLEYIMVGIGSGKEAGFLQVARAPLELYP